MSTPIEKNTTDLQTILDMVNALPEGGSGGGSENLDAELTEQENLISELSGILDTKASGGGGSSASYTSGSLSFTNLGMYEPGVNEYHLTSPDLKSSSRLIIVVMFYSLNGSVAIAFRRATTAEEFVSVGGSSVFSLFDDAIRSDGSYVLDDNTIFALGSIVNATQLHFFAV